MSRIPNLRLRSKLLLGAAAVIAVMGGAGLWSAYELRTTSRQYRDVLEHGAHAAVDAERLNVLFLLQVQAVNDTWLRGGDPEQFRASAAEFEARGAEIRALRPALDGRPHAEERQLLERFDTGWAAYLSAWEQARIAYGGAGGDNAAAAGALMKGKDREVVAALHDLAVLFHDRSAVEGDALVVESHRALLIALAVIGTTTVVGLTFVWLFAAGISRAVSAIAAAARRVAAEDMPELAAAARALADGDLTRRIALRVQPVVTGRRDELGEMTAAFNTMIDGLTETGAAFERMRQGLTELTGQVQQTATALAEAGNQIGIATNEGSAAIQDLTLAISSVATGATEQTQQVSESDRLTRHLTQGIAQVSTLAANVAEQAQRTHTAAGRGADDVRLAVSEMHAIAEVVTVAAGRVEDLGRLGERIGRVVETIDDIAEQTNLLALNAAIEASRAGVHGRGFAVVADEIRKLAERSQGETRAIAQLIGDVQRGTGDAVAAMTRGGEQVRSGLMQADRAGAALAQILAALEEATANVGNIAAASDESATGARELREAMTEVRAVVESNSAATEQMAAQSEELSAQMQELAAQAEVLTVSAAGLTAAVSRFRIERPTAPTAFPIGSERAA